MKPAIAHNELNEINCWYTIAGRYDNAAEAERSILDKMGPSNQPKNSILTLAAKSVISRKDKELMQEESKLMEKYYQDYYKDNKSRSSSKNRSNSKDKRFLDVSVGLKVLS